jgi:hypothetical protein
MTVRICAKPHCDRQVFARSPFCLACRRSIRNCGGRSRVYIRTSPLKTKRYVEMVLTRLDQTSKAQRWVGTR